MVVKLPVALIEETSMTLMVAEGSTAVVLTLGGKKELSTTVEASLVVVTELVIIADVVVDDVLVVAGCGSLPTVVHVSSM